MYVCLSVGINHSIYPLYLCMSVVFVRQSLLYTVCDWLHMSVRLIVILCVSGSQLSVCLYVTLRTRIYLSLLSFGQSFIHSLLFMCSLSVCLSPCLFVNQSILSITMRVALTVCATTISLMHI